MHPNVVPRNMSKIPISPDLHAEFAKFLNRHVKANKKVIAQPQKKKPQ